MYAGCRKCENDGEIEESDSSATTHGQNSTGGLVGTNSEGYIATSFATGDVDVPLTDDGNENVGGLAGYNDSTIEDTYATGSATGYEDVGGLVGDNDGDIYNSYSIGDVTANETFGGLVGDMGNGELAHTFSASQVIGVNEGSSRAGGLAGQIDEDADIYNSYYDMERTGRTHCHDDGQDPDPEGCTGVNGENSQPDYFKGNNDNSPLDVWNFTGIWEIRSNDYPVLRDVIVRDEPEINFDDLKVLLVKNDPGISHEYLDNHDIDYDIIEPSEFASASVEFFLGYNVVIYESGDDPQYDNLRTGLPTLSTAMEEQGIVVSIRVAGNQGSQENIDFYDTDFVQEYGGEVDFADTNSRFLTGEDIGGIELDESYFSDWDDTYHGWLDETPTEQDEYNEILTSEFRPLWIEYEHEEGFVMVDTLTAVDGGWGEGNSDVADNYIRYIAWLADDYTEPVENGDDSDYNGDNIPDSEQPQVSSYISPITGKRVVIDVGEGCELNIDDIIRESDLDVQDPGYEYGNGLFDFEAECEEEGFVATIRLFYYDVLVDDLVVRKHNRNTNAYFTIPGATLTQATIHGSSVAVAQYEITEGGELDMDNELNGVIVDPAGLASSVVGSPNTGFERN